MPGPWAHLDSLIRELGEISILPNAAAAEGPLAEATIAVSKATELLARAAQSRGRRRTDRPAQEALTAIEEARAAVARARAVLLHSGTEARRGGAAATVPF